MKFTDQLFWLTNSCNSLTSLYKIWKNLTKISIIRARVCIHSVNYLNEDQLPFHGFLEGYINLYFERDWAGISWTLLDHLTVRKTCLTISTKLPVTVETHQHRPPISPVPCYLPLQIVLSVVSSRTGVYCILDYI